MHRFPPSVRTLLRGLNSSADEFTPGAGYYMPKVSPGHNWTITSRPGPGISSQRP